MERLVIKSLENGEGADGLMLGKSLDESALLQGSLNAMRLGQDEDALGLLEALLAREPESAYARYVLGALHAQAGLTEQAETGKRSLSAPQTSRMPASNRVNCSWFRADPKTPAPSSPPWLTPRCKAVPMACSPLPVAIFPLRSNCTWMKHEVAERWFELKYDSGYDAEHRRGETKSTGKPRGE